MTRESSCRVCWHPDAAEINRLIVRGTPTSQISRLYNVSRTYVEKHRKAHVPLVLRIEQDNLVALNANDLMWEFQDLYTASKRLLDDAQRALQTRPPDTPGHDRAHVMVAQALREAARLWELGARICGLDDDGRLESREQAITIRVVEESPPHRDKFHDVVRNQPALPAGSNDGEERRDDDE